MAYLLILLGYFSGAVLDGVTDLIIKKCRDKRESGGDQ